MKSDIDIKDDIYFVIKGSALHRAVTGKLSKTLRPANSYKEDIVISVLANNCAQLQEAYVNVNIYVRDNNKDGQNEENSIRLRELCSLSRDLFERGYRDDFRYELSSQRVLAIDGGGEHIINNKILYQQINETYYGNRLG